MVQQLILLKWFGFEWSVPLGDRYLMHHLKIWQQAAEHIGSDKLIQGDDWQAKNIKELTFQESTQYHYVRRLRIYVHNQVMYQISTIYIL
jgi:hypothetical protein